MSAGRYRMNDRRGVVRDPKGTVLHATLLLVIDRDERGRPTRTRICHDDETMGLVTGAEGKNEFIVVWAPAALTMHPKAATAKQQLEAAKVDVKAELKVVDQELRDAATKGARLEERLRIAKKVKAMAEQHPWPEDYEPTEAERATAKGLREWLEQLAVDILEEGTTP